MTLKVSSQSLIFEDKGGYALSPHVLFAEIEALDGPVYIGVLYTTNGLAGCSYDLSSNPFKVLVTPRPSIELATGTYEDEVIILVCKDEACEKQVSGSPSVVSVRYTVRSPFQRTQPQQLSFTAVMGSSVRPSTHVRLETAGSLDWAASADTGWIQLPITQGTSTIFGSEVPVMVDPVDLAMGKHSGTITLSDRKTGNTHPIPVTLEMLPATLSTEPKALVMGGTDGTALSARQLAVSLDTGGYAYHWKATVDTGSDPQWLQLSSSTGTASSTPSVLTASVDTTGLRGGTYSASVTFTATVKGQAVSHTVPVTLRLAEHSLWAPENGVALVSTPSFSRLTHTVMLKDSWGLSTTPWTATSNQPWLTVTPAGTSSAPLTLTASPEGLTRDTLHSATVTLRSTDASVARDETIQVGLWVGASASNDRDTVSIFESSGPLEVDPIRPYAYVRGSTGTLSVYNVHTAALVTHLTGLTRSAGPMAVSTDGSTLYALDTDTHQVVPVDLRTLTAGKPWDTGQSQASSIRYARPSGHGVLLINGNHIFDASTGAAFPPVTTGLTSGPLSGVVSKDGSLLCGEGYAYSYLSTYCWGLRYSNLDGGSVSLKYLGSPYINGENVTDVAISPDSSRVYSSLYGSLRLAIYEGKTLERLTTASWEGHGSGDALAMSPEGLLYLSAGSNSDSTRPDIFISDREGSLVGSFRFAQSWSYLDALRISGDGKRLVARVRYRGMRFGTVP